MPTPQLAATTPGSCLVAPVNWPPRRHVSVDDEPHLRVLLDATSRATMPYLRPESMVAMQAWLDQIQAHWNEQLQSFKRHIAGKAASR